MRTSGGVALATQKLQRQRRQAKLAVQAKTTYRNFEKVAELDYCVQSCSIGDAKDQ